MTDGKFNFEESVYTMNGIANEMVLFSNDTDLNVI